MISVEEALGLLERATSALEVLETPLEHARGRVLAEAVAADRDFPPTDRSAMDGYAVRSGDLDRPGRVLEIVGELRAGHPVADLQVGTGHAARIMTGAIVPPGADAVVMVEKTEELDSRRVRVNDGPRPGQHIRKRGEDIAGGATALEAGTPIRAAEVAALASLGCTVVRVHRAPAVHVLSTGDEIVEADRQPEAHQVRNSNAHVLLAQLAEMGLEGRYLGIAGDERGALDRALEKGLEGDVLLITGGVSAGKYDLVESALEAAGVQLLFHRVSVKPGKPILAGRRRSCLVVGLPGNPVSTFTAFTVFVAPALRRMLGYRNWRNRFVTARLVEPVNARQGRETYHLARLETGKDGLEAGCAPSRGSGDVLALSRANGFIVTPAGGASLARGASVHTLAWTFHHFRD